MPSRFFIVDDNPQFLSTATDLLQGEGVEVVGVALSGEEASRLVPALAPHVVLVDIDLGAESGFDIAARLAEYEGVRVVMISAYEEAEFEDLIAGSPAAGFVPKAHLSARAVADVLGC
jgi:two-component system nitrate/nitrite response regulator NarL